MLQTCSEMMQTDPQHPQLSLHLHHLDLAMLQTSLHLMQTLAEMMQIMLRNPHQPCSPLPNDLQTMQKTVTLGLRPAEMMQS